MDDLNAVTMTRYGRLDDDLRQVLADMHSEARHHRLSESYYALPRWLDRLAQTASEHDAFEVVVASEQEVPVAFAYGAQLPVLDPDGSTAFGIGDLVVRTLWRGQGLERMVHDELLRGRGEAQSVACALVADAVERALWVKVFGYREVGPHMPEPGAPELVAMVRPIGDRAPF